MRIPTILPLMPLAVSLACGAANRDDVDNRVANSPDDPPAEVVQTQEVEAAQANPIGDDWEAWVTAEARRIQSEDPDVYNAVKGLEARSTRAGLPRFTGPIVRQSAAAPLLLERFMTGGESVEVKVALIDALPRTGGPFGAAVVGLYASEQEAKIREVMMMSLRTADAGSALEGLKLGLADKDPSVRIEAARTTARRQDGVALADDLIAAANDPSPVVVIEAIRSLGALEIEPAKDLLTSKLSDADSDIRLASLRALGRIDPTYTASLPQLKGLSHDSDPRVSKAATKLSAP